MEEKPDSKRAKSGFPGLPTDVSASCGECLLLQLNPGCCGDIFIDDACYQHFLTALLQSQRPFHIEVHAYALLPGSVLILATPVRSQVVGKWIRHCTDAYSDYYQQRFRRMSLPFSANIDSSRVTGRELILSAYCFVESAPLRAMLCKHPASYRWSSHCSNAFGGQLTHLTQHPLLRRCFAHSATPHADYRETISAGLAAEFLAYIERRLGSSLPLAKACAPVRRVRVSRRIHQLPHGTPGRIHETRGTYRYNQGNPPE